MRDSAYMRLIVAIVRQAIEDVRHPEVWDWTEKERPALRILLREEAKAWLLDSELIDLAARAWNMPRETLIQRIADYTRRGG